MADLTTCKCGYPVAPCEGAAYCTREIPKPSASRNSGTWADGFAAGQKSVRRTNKSGCCCMLDEQDNVVSPCQAHIGWLNAAVSEPTTASRSDDAFIAARLDYIKGHGSTTRDELAAFHDGYKAAIAVSELRTVPPQSFDEAQKVYGETLKRLRERFEQWFKMTYPLFRENAGRDTTLKHQLWTVWQVAHLSPSSNERSES